MRGFAPAWLLALCLPLAIWLAAAVARNAPDPNTLALGEQTKSVYGSFEGRKMFCGNLDQTRECLATAAASSAHRRVLWLGNSQLHAINQAQPGQRTSPVQLAALLKPKGAQVMGFSMPNATFSEMLLMDEWLADSYRPDVLVFPAFLSNTRELPVRGELAPALARGDIAALLDANGIGADLRARLEKDGTAAEPDHRPSLQERSENALTARLEACCRLQTTRARAKEMIEVYAFQLRNLVFHVTAQSIRPIVPDTYARNLAAARVLLADAHRRGVKAIVYIPPIRHDVALPYDPAQYAAFKREIRAMAEANGAQFADFDTLVPGEDWGAKGTTHLGGGTELDFKHYREAGHALLANAIAPLVVKDLP